MTKAPLTPSSGSGSFSPLVPVGHIMTQGPYQKELKSSTLPVIVDEIYKRNHNFFIIVSTPIGESQVHGSVVLTFLLL
jgi:hypothetical protein